MDTNIFGGLEDLGIGGLSGANLFGNEKPSNNSGSEGAAPPQKTPEEIEEEMLLDKSYECPICSNAFKTRAIRTGKARLIGSDPDLRSKFEGIEPLKYDVISCTKCGFTALTRFFKPVTPMQRKNILEKISATYKGDTEYHRIFTYEQAIARYKLALANAVVKMAKASEKAYICLRAGWLCRSMGEYIEANTPNDKEKLEQAKALENEFLKNAYDGFCAARQSESFPMCGMDESTVDYLIACLAERFGHYDVCSKMIASLLASPSVGPRMKDKVRDLKEDVKLKMKQ